MFRKSHCRSTVIMSEKIKRNLELYKELILCDHDLYLSSYDTRWVLLESNCPKAEWMDKLFQANVPKLPEEIRYPLIISSEVGLIWLAAFEMDSTGAIEKIHVIGPAFTEDVSINSLLRILENMGLHFSEKKETLAYYLESVPIIPIMRFFEYGLMLHYCLTGEHITNSYLLFEKIKAGSVETDSTEIGAATDSHASWAMEQALLKLIEEGNPDYKRLAGRLVGAGSRPDLGNGDSIRHYKNLTIIFTALCTRAAIRGGLLPEIAYSISDIYINGIEASRDLPEIYEINDAMQKDFVHRVWQCKRNGKQSPQIQTCCYYIQTHLTLKLTVGELARITGYSETHLSKKFKQEMGLSITDYITEQKLEYAKELLHSNNCPVGEIAEYLGFTSQSYFANQFRKREGMTPGEYRSKVNMRENTQE